MRYVLGVAFLAFAVWALIPDKLDEPQEDGPPLWRVPNGARDVLYRRDGRQDAARDDRDGRAILEPTCGNARNDARHDDRERAGGTHRREARAEISDPSKMRFVAAALFAIFGLLVLFNFSLGLLPSSFAS